MVNIAIHNIHLAPNIKNIGIHNYIFELIKSGEVKYLFFEERSLKKQLEIYHHVISGNLLPKDVINKNVQMLFSRKELMAKCDVILNFNTHTGAHDFTPSIKKFTGLKVWHLGDYFWNERGSAINKRLEEYGIDYVMGYSSHDKHCPYFQKTFPKYVGKVIPVPFGYQDRFVKKESFTSRKNKCIGLGSVNPLRPLEYPIENYIETANFYPDEAWFHKFRRMLVKDQSRLVKHFDSKFPIFPKIKDFEYDLVSKFNEYRMFVSDESIFNFPPAKYFEGPACGTALVCANMDCNKEYGFKDGVNCIMYERYDVDNFVSKIKYYQKHDDDLERIQKSGYNHVTSNFSHKKIAKKIINDVLSRSKEN